VKILLDMNLSPTWVSFFETAGIDAVHWSSLGAPDADDSELMAWARLHDAIVFTNDLDFSALLAVTRDNGPSVLQTRTQDLMPGAIGEMIVNVLRDYREQFSAGVLITVDEHGSRVRILPLRSEPA
jgi:predicted nuclease of predicted toxin-antitoxin system